MPKIDFTTRGVEALKPATRPVDYWSTAPAERGFGLRVLPSGTKSWFVWTRKTKTGKPTMVTLGNFPDMKLAGAREAAEDARAEVKHGESPAEDRREARQAQRDTVQALFDKYAEHVAVRRQAGEFKSWPDVKRSFERDVLPAWGDRPARSIERRDVIELVTRKALVGRTAANRLQAHVSMLFSYGVDHDWLSANPALRLKKRAEQPRDRVLSADELTTLWTYLESDAPMALSRGVKAASLITMPARTAATLRDLFKLLVLGGQRLGETSRMAWSDVDLDARTWTVPAAQAKNRTAHRVPLSPPMLAIVKARAEAAPPTSRYVFPSDEAGLFSVHVWSKRAAATIAAATTIAFTAHDLRRTCASGLGELGISSDVISLVLNHKKPGVTGRHYDLSTRETAKREALDLWAQRVHTHRHRQGREGAPHAPRPEGRDRMTRDELALWTHEAKAVTDLLTRIERQQYARLAELGCPRDMLAVDDILARRQAAPWPPRHDARDRRRARQALDVLILARQIRGSIGLVGENARLAAYYGMMVGALADDVVLEAAVGTTMLRTLRAATHEATRARQAAAATRHRQLDDEVRDYRCRYPSLSESALADRLVQKHAGEFGYSKSTILRRLKDSLPTP